MKQNSNIVEYGDWVIRQRLPGNFATARLMLLLHGWTGDENSMWIFAPRIPENYMILAPRGTTSTPLGGFGWENTGVASWPRADDFQTAIQDLFNLVDSINYPGVSVDQIDIMGFSQGAALAYTMMLKYPTRIGRLAGLSGFLPDGLGDEIMDHNLSGKKIFVSHGTRDDIVSLEKARNAVRDLKLAGADVIYCEEDVGHKLSAGCFRAMDDYFSQSI